MALGVRDEIARLLEAKKPIDGELQTVVLFAGALSALVLKEFRKKEKKCHRPNRLPGNKTLMRSSLN